MKVWNTTSGLCFVTFTEHTSSITNVTFTSSGFVVVSASLDGTVRAFDLHRYRSIREGSNDHVRNVRNTDMLNVVYFSDTFLFRILHMQVKSQSRKGLHFYLIYLLFNNDYFSVKLWCELYKGLLSNSQTFCLFSGTVTLEH